MLADNFKRFSLKQELIEALSQLGIRKPTDIQERLIPVIRNGRDVIGQSETGTGKTFAFLLPIVDKVDPGKNEVQAVITAPTRELATQLYEELQKLLVAFKEEERLKARLLIGGTDRQREIERLHVQPQVVIGTPGRILDFVKEQVLDVYTATILVVDEADQMLDMGFIYEVDQIASRMAKNLQMLVFSATIPEKLQSFLRKYMTNPKHVHVRKKTAKIEHRLVPLRSRDKLSFTVELASNLQPFLAIVFANTKEDVDELANAMLAAGLNVERLHGGLLPRQRKRVMRLVHDFKVQYLVATDIAARGIDIPGVSHIINYQLPKDLDFYIHRAGRTGRAGADGIVYTIFEQKDQYVIQQLLKRDIAFTFYDLKDGEWTELTRPAWMKASPSKKKK